MATRDQWRYCVKCHAMFYDGYADKGRCQAGGGHQALGYNFVLPHDLTSPQPTPSTPPPPARPTINVTQPPGSVLAVSGSGFRPNAQVRVRFTVGVIGNESSAFTSTDGSGSFTLTAPVSGIPLGTTIWVSATDGTSDRSDQHRPDHIHAALNPPPRREGKGKRPASA